MTSRARFVLAVPALLVALVALAPVRPSAAAKKSRFPNVVGTWDGTVQYDDGRPEQPAHLRVTRQRQANCSGKLDVGAYTSLPVTGKVSTGRKFTLRLNYRGNKGTFNGQLNESIDAAQGRWSLKQGKTTTRGSFVLNRQ
jgi:hypothetical protein